jgi:hypothetical protein
VYDEGECLAVYVRMKTKGDAYGGRLKGVNDRTVQRAQEHRHDHGQCLVSDSTNGWTSWMPRQRVQGSVRERIEIGIRLLQQVGDAR